MESAGGVARSVDTKITIRIGSGETNSSGNQLQKSI